MNWWIIGIGVIILFIIGRLVHFRAVKHKVTALIVVFFLLFLLSTFSSVIQEHSLDWKSPSGLLSAGKIYFSWLGNAFGNFKTITVNAVKMDWSVTNLTSKG